MQLQKVAMVEDHEQHVVCWEHLMQFMIIRLSQSHISDRTFAPNLALEASAKFAPGKGPRSCRRQHAINPIAQQQRSFALISLAAVTLSLGPLTSLALRGIDTRVDS